MLFFLLFSISIFYSFVSAVATTTTITVPDNIIEEATIRWCPEYDLRPTEDEETIYITYYRTTTVYWTSWTTVTKCSSNICSQVTTLTTGTGGPPTASDVVERTTTYTVFSTTTNYYTDWDIIEYCPNTVASTSTSVTPLRESTEEVTSPLVTSTVENETATLVSTPTLSSSDDDEDVTSVTVYQTTTSPLTTWTILTSCSDNRCFLITSFTTTNSPIGLEYESSESERALVEQGSTDQIESSLSSDTTSTIVSETGTFAIQSSKIEEVVFSLSLEGPATTLDEVLTGETNSEMPLSATTEFGTTTVTITSCSDNSCFEIRTVTGVLTVTDDTTTNTTFCPLTTSEESQAKSLVSSSSSDDISDYVSSTLTTKSESLSSTPGIPAFESSTSDVLETSPPIVKLIESPSSTLYFSSSSYSTSIEGPSFVERVSTNSLFISDACAQSQPNVSSTLSVEESTVLAPSTFDKTSFSLPIDTTLPPPHSTTTKTETTVIALTFCSNDACSQCTRTVVLSTLIEGSTVFPSSSTISEIKAATSSAAEASSVTPELSSATGESSFSTIEPSSTLIESSSTYTTIAAVNHVSSTDDATSVGSSLEPLYFTTDAIHTTIITITSCSGDICSKVTHTIDFTTVTEDTTVYTTYSPLSTSVESAPGEELFILS